MCLWVLSSYLCCNCTAIIVMSAGQKLACCVKLLLRIVVVVGDVEVFDRAYGRDMLSL